ncbi:MAG: DUF6287 domain-containing protein [Streptococcus sp.]
MTLKSTTRQKQAVVTASQTKRLVDINAIQNGDFSSIAGT